MHDFLFGIFPYIALVTLVVGSIARCERDPFTWKTSSSQLLRRKQLVLGGILLVTPSTWLAHVISGVFVRLRYLFLRTCYLIVRSPRSEPLPHHAGPVGLARYVAQPRVPTAAKPVTDSGA